MAVESGVVNKLFLCQGVGLQFSLQFGAIPIKTILLVLRICEVIICQESTHTEYDQKSVIALVVFKGMNDSLTGKGETD